MIDSAEKFVMVYTESLPAPRSGLDAFLEVLSTGQESSSDITDQSLARPGPAEAKEGAVRATGPTAPKDVPEPGRVTVVDTSFPVYDPGTVELTGTVHHVGLEGGFWAITGDNGQKYDPLNLPEELEQAGVKVRLWVRIRKDIATTRMWGLPVQIVRYVVPKSEPKR